MPPELPRVSIVICSDGRAASLANTLSCLQHLDGPDFEVCVVQGPTEDGTTEVLAGWAGRIKTVRNAERNLSVSRNLGIALTTGEIVVFIDDDALPEPAWLVELLVAFDDPQVGGAGGIVTDHTGAQVQYRYASANRLGQADWQRDTPADVYNFPLSFNFPYVQGTNSAFRRTALLAVGGFDEEFEFYLDEADLCCRLVDAGWLIRQLPNATVHHKFLPSAIRTADRVTRVLYPVLKNKLYFSLVNNQGHYGLSRAVNDMTGFIQDQEAGLRHHVEAGRLAATDLVAFRADTDRAWATGLERGMSGARRLLKPELLPNPEPFLPFAKLLPQGGREVIVFVSQEYPPGRMGGIGRYIHQLAREVAALGHHVHVLTRGTGHDRIDFEDRVWVHRIIPRDVPAPPPGIAVPPHIWTHSATMLDALRSIARHQAVTAVYAPIWDCEGITILLDGTLPLVTGLQTSLSFWMRSHPHITTDPAFQRDFVTPMLALEARLLRESDAVHAISRAIARDISEAYDVTFDEPRAQILPLGLEDWSGHPVLAPEALPDGALRLLFVGRLESRKGIDVLLEVLPRLFARHLGLHADIVGNDTIPGPDGKPYRAVFEAALPPELGARIRFHGEVSEARLRGFYRACDVFVAPSRYESFGLILVEAMMYGKPAVASRAGGMVEVVEEGRTALLAEPGDATSLEACLERLALDPSLRQEMGEAARQRYEAKFAPGPMAAGMVALFRRAAAGATS
jgi:glycogen(starch) synthase